MGWLTLLLPLLLKLIEWLLSADRLNARQKKKVNLLLAKCEELKTAAAAMGCKPVNDPAVQREIMEESGTGR